MGMDAEQLDDLRDRLEQYRKDNCQPVTEIGDYSLADTGTDVTFHTDFPFVPDEELSEIFYDLFGRRYTINSSAKRVAEKVRDQELEDHIEALELAMDLIEHNYDGVTKRDYNVWCVEGGHEIVCEQKTETGGWDHVATVSKEFVAEIRDAKGAVNVESGPSMVPTMRDSSTTTKTPTFTTDVVDYPTGDDVVTLDFNYSDD